MSKEIVGVIGAGSFGIAISNLLAENSRVLMYARRQEVVDQINKDRTLKEQPLHQDIEGTNSLEEVANRCHLIFPVIPSKNFRAMLKDLSPFLKPDHILIHGTKGLEVDLPREQKLEDIRFLRAAQVKTMSELIAEETIVIRSGCISGPNLSREIYQGQPAATVVASRFKEVIEEGKNALRSRRFRVHGNSNILAVELAGVFKNIIAIASGIVAGLGYGFNSKALMITGGLAEMAYLGKQLGVGTNAFFGLAGVGDLVATCSSSTSRNYTVGFRLAGGEKLDDILTSMNEVAEGVKTIRIARAMSNQYKIPTPITEVMYRILFEALDVKDAVRILMEYPFEQDTAFLE